MDISKIRARFGERFLMLDSARYDQAERDYTDAENALRALKSLFQSELETRERTRRADRRVTLDREV